MAYTANFDFILFGTPGTTDYHARKSQFIQALNSQLQALWNDAVDLSPKAFFSRAEAVAYGQANLPQRLARIFTIEDGQLVLRGHGQSSADPLFPTAPYWGVLARFPSQGLMANIIRDYGIMDLQGLGGSGDEITAGLPTNLVALGINSLSVSSEIEYIPATTNLLDNPTLTISATVDGTTTTNTYTIRNADGGPWPARGFIVGRAYKLRRRNNVLRVVSGEATAFELSRTPYAITANSPSGTDVPTNRSIVMTSVGGVQLWDEVAAPTPATETNDLKLDANGRWWLRVFDSRTTESGGLRVYGSRSEAEAGLAANPLPSQIQRILVMESGRMVYRVRTGSTRDPLFTTEPTWGVESSTPTGNPLSTIFNAAPGDDVVIVQAANGPALLVDSQGRTRGTFLASDIEGGFTASLPAPRAPGDYIVPLIMDQGGNIILGLDIRDGSIFPTPAGGGGGSSVTFVDPDNIGDAWNSIQTQDAIGTVTRYMSRQWRECWGYEKRGDVTIAQTPNPAMGIVAFGGGSAAVVRPLTDDFPYHVRNEAMVRPEDGTSSTAHSVAWLEQEYARRRGLPTVLSISQLVASTVEADALAGSAPRNALRAKVVAAKNALKNNWGKDFLIDRILLSLLEGAPNTLQETARIHYAAVANSMRQELATAAEQAPMPIVLVNQSAGTRTDGRSEVILAEGNLDWAHWSLGLVVPTPRYPFPLQPGSPATLTPQAALLVNELEALAASERLAARQWFGPTMGAQCTLAGAVITVPFTAMSNLVLRDAARHGFAVDGITNGATISSVAVNGTNVLITLSAAPAGSLTVRYAFGETGDRGDGFPCNRGSLTDSWSQASQMVSGSVLYRYARSGRAPVV